MIRDYDDRLIRMPEVQRLTGLGRSSLYAMARDGRFVRPIKLSERASAWPESKVKAWVAQRIDAAKAAA